VEYEKAGGTRKSERKRPAKKNNGNGKTAWLNHGHTENTEIGFWFLFLRSKKSI
jgi:hypothetical protein